MSGITDKTVIATKRMSLTAPAKSPPEKTRRFTFALEIKCEDDELEVELSEVNEHAPLVPLARKPAVPETPSEPNNKPDEIVPDEPAAVMPGPTADGNADVMDWPRDVLDKVLDDVMDEALFRKGLRGGERRTSSQYGDEGVELDVSMEDVDEPSDFTCSTHDDDPRDWTVTTGELSYNGDTRLEDL